MTRISSNTSKKYLTYLTFYLGIIHFNYLLITLLAGKKFPVFIVIDIVAIFTGIMTVRYALKSVLLRFSLLDYAVFLYLVISVSSILLYLQPDNNVSILAYAYGLHLLIFPCLLFFSVKLLDRESQTVLIGRVCILNTIFIIYGFTMFYLRPEFYTNYLLNNLFAEQNIEGWVAYARMQSYFGSSAVGTLSYVTLILLMILNVKGLKRILLFSFFTAAALLSQQRGGMLGVGMALGYFFFLRKEKLCRKIIFLAVFISLIASIFTVYSSRYADKLPYNLLEYTKNKIVDDLVYGNPFAERKISRDNGWKVITEFPMGMGAGATTSGADSAGANPGGQIVDANFFRIWADLGILGITSFMLILLFSFKSAINTRQPMAWSIIILMYCIQALGSNVFDNFYVSHMFWLLLGVIDSQRLGHGKSVMLTTGDRINIHHDNRICVIS